MPGLEPKLRKGIYYAVGTVAGKRVRQSLGTRDETRAHELCAQHEARLWKRATYGEEAVRTFDEAAVNYLDAGGETRYIKLIPASFRARTLASIRPGEVTALA